MTELPELIRCPPVLICGFARPDTLQVVFNRVREARPSQLYLWLNKPREDRPDEVKRNAECKEILAKVDWPCQVTRHYSEVYMECRDSLEGAFTWYFEHVDRGIILEDDCVPDLTFFRYCGELLEKYKDDGRVGMISGHIENRKVSKLKPHGASYYFDRFSFIWGWATWRRAWQMHDPQMKYFPELYKQFEIMYGYYRDMPTVRRRRERLWGLYKRLDGSWDGAWLTTFQMQNWLCIHPYVNLVSNIGNDRSCRVNAKSLKQFLRYKSPWDNVPTTPMHFPLNHPMTMMPNPFAEHYTFIDFVQLHYFRWWITHKPYYAANWLFGKLFK